MKKREKHTQRRIMTVKQVSDYLNIPTSTVYELVRKGKIRGVRFGKHWRVLEKDIAAYLEGALKTVEQPEDFAERREHPRINAEIPAILTIGLSEKSEVNADGIIRNLSEGGVLLQSKSADDGKCKGPEVGDPVTLVFEIPEAGQSKIEVKGRVIYLLNHSGESLGIKFTGLSDHERGAIKDYVG